MKVNGVPASTAGVKLTVARQLFSGNVIRGFAERVTQ
jgi:hypothetical protein